jgi:hypothetical protein
MDGENYLCLKSIYLNFFFNQMIIWIINEIKLNAHDSPQN